MLAKTAVEFLVAFLVSGENRIAQLILGEVIAWFLGSEILAILCKQNIPKLIDGVLRTFSRIESVFEHEFAARISDGKRASADPCGFVANRALIVPSLA